MADYTELKRQLAERGERDFAALADLFELCRATEDHETTSEIRRMASGLMRQWGGVDALDLYNRSLIYDGAVNFDCFMRALERNRPIKEQFWLPRRKHLMPICKALQDMEDNNLDELFLSCPPRVGKTTLMVMFLLWTMGRNTEGSNLYCSFTSKPVDTFYAGLLEVLKDPNTYAYADLFPNVKLVGTNANDTTLDLDRKKRYPSFTGRPIRGSLNGSCDCNRYVIGDDLCEGYEEAINKERMLSLWATVDNNLITRAKEQAKRLWIGTRWSLIDPQGIRLDLLRNEEKFKSVRWKVVNVPALDENEESNFDYAYGVGFSTEYYQQRRASFERNNDMASWLAQYQGEPIERSGAVFDPSDMRTYNGVLPDGDPDRCFLVCDPSWGGGDYVAAPVCIQYGTDIYVPAVVYDNSDKTVTQPLIMAAVEKYGVTAMKIEGTKTTASYGEDIDKRLRELGTKVNIQTNVSHYNGLGKRDRIIARAPDIREHMIFLKEGIRPKEYSQFMQNLYSCTYTGKMKNDDACDVCAMVIDFAFRGGGQVTVFKRPF